MTTGLITIDQYRQQGFNVLVPSQKLEQITPFHALRLEVVNINPNPDAGEVFKVGSKLVKGQWESELCLSKNALMKIASSAGIIFNWTETKLVHMDQNTVVYKAVGGIRTPSGDFRVYPGTKEIDLIAIEAETFEANLKKGQELIRDSQGNIADKRKSAMNQLKGFTEAPAWAEYQTKQNMIAWRKNKVMRAETGAMLRVIRALLAIKAKYSEEELKHPFVVPRIDFAPDFNDPMVKQMVLAKGLTATTDLFGAQPTVQSIGAGMENPYTFNNDAEVVDVVEEEYQEPDEVITQHVVENDARVVDQEITLGEYAQEQSGQAPAEEDPSQDPTICKGCGCKVKSEKVIEISNKKYGKTICFNCQKQM